MPLTPEKLERELGVHGFSVRSVEVNDGWFVQLTNQSTKLSIWFPLTRDGRVIGEYAIHNLRHFTPLGVTFQGYLFLFSDLEREIQEFIEHGILQGLNAVLATHKGEQYLLPAEMASELPPNVPWNNVTAYEDAGGYIAVYGPKVYATLPKRRASKNLFVRVNGMKPERVVWKLWQPLLGGQT